MVIISRTPVKWHRGCAAAGPMRGPHGASTDRRTHDMSALLLIPVVLSFVVLAAHVVRLGIPFLPFLLALAPLLLITRQVWAVRFLQFVLVMGTLEWVRTTMVLTRYRMVEGEPWTRMAVILVTVALVTAASALALQHRRFLRPTQKG